MCYLAISVLLSWQEIHARRLGASRARSVIFVLATAEMIDRRSLRSSRRRHRGRIERWSLGRRSLGRLLRSGTSCMRRLVASAPLAVLLPPARAHPPRIIQQAMTAERLLFTSRRTPVGWMESMMKRRHNATWSELSYVISVWEDCWARTFYVDDDCDDMATGIGFDKL